MRLFFIGWDGVRQGMIDAAVLLRERGHRVAYLTSSELDAYPVGRDLPDTILHHHRDAMWAVPAAGVDAAQFLPPGKELLGRLREAESVALTIMNKQYPSLCVEERKHLYYRFVQYWDGVLREQKPDAVVFPLPPHVPHEFVIYALAQLKRIKTVMFLAMQDSDRLLIMNDFTEGSRALRDAAYADRGERYSATDMADDVRAYYMKHTDPQRDATPRSVRNLKAQYGGRWSEIIAKSFKDLTFFEKGARYIAKRLGVTIQKEYARVTTVPDFSRKFVYVPLQYQPEMTTSPLAGVFVDQRLMIEMIAAVVPPDWVLYVKEHPRQLVSLGTNFSQYRYRGYYEGIARLKNVRVVPVQTDTYRLIGAAQAVATCTGTAALEAVLRGKPALVFGFTWFQYCPGVFCVRDADSCRQAINAAVHGVPVDRQRVINHLVHYGRISFRGYVDPHVQVFSQITAADNGANIAAALHKALVE